MKKNSVVLDGLMKKNSAKLLGTSKELNGIINKKTKLIFVFIKNDGTIKGLLNC